VPCRDWVFYYQDYQYNTGIIILSVLSYLVEIEFESLQHGSFSIGRPERHHFTELFFEGRVHPYTPAPAIGVVVPLGSGGGGAVNATACGGGGGGGGGGLLRNEDGLVFRPCTWTNLDPPPIESDFQTGDKIPFERLKASLVTRFHARLGHFVPKCRLVPRNVLDDTFGVDPTTRVSFPVRDELHHDFREVLPDVVLLFFTTRYVVVATLCVRLLTAVLLLFMGYVVAVMASLVSHRLLRPAYLLGSQSRRSTR
jgi:hypothetical protein